MDLHVFLIPFSASWPAFPFSFHSPLPLLPTHSLVSPLVFDAESFNSRNHILMHTPRYGSACIALPIDDPPILHTLPTDNLLQGIIGHKATLHRAT